MRYIIIIVVLFASTNSNAQSFYLFQGQFERIELDSISMSSSSGEQNGIVGYGTGKYKLYSLCSKDTNLAFVSFGCSNLLEFDKKQITILIYPRYYFEYECICEDDESCEDKTALRLIIKPNGNKVKYEIGLEYDKSSKNENKIIMDLAQKVSDLSNINLLSVKDKETILLNYFEFLLELAKTEPKDKSNRIIHELNPVLQTYNKEMMIIEPNKLDYYNHVFSILGASAKSKDAKNFIDWYVYHFQENF